MRSLLVTLTILLCLPLAGHAEDESREVSRDFELQTRILQRSIAFELALRHPTEQFFNELAATKHEADRIARLRLALVNRHAQLVPPTEGLLQFAHSVMYFYDKRLVMGKAESLPFAKLSGWAEEYLRTNGSGGKLAMQLQIAATGLRNGAEPATSFTPVMAKRYNDLVRDIGARPLAPLFDLRGYSPDQQTFLLRRGKQISLQMLTRARKDVEADVEGTTAGNEVAEKCARFLIANDN